MYLRIYVSTLLGMPGGDKDATSVSLLTSFGLGTKRSLDQLISFTGIDTRSKQAFGYRCKQLYWVSYIILFNFNYFILYIYSILIILFFMFYSILIILFNINYFIQY
jgi:hypothetical protein